MSFLTAETDLSLDTLAKSVLILGAPYSGGWESLVQAVIQSVQSGKRVYCLDGKGEWLAKPSPAPEIKIRKLSKVPEKFPPVFPAGELQVIPVYETKANTGLAQLLIKGDKEIGGADLLLFSRVTSAIALRWYMAFLRAADDWKEHTQIVLYQDAFHDAYLPLIPHCDEMIVFPHDAGPELQSALLAGMVSKEEFDQMPTRHFLRIPDPYHTFTVQGSGSALT